MDLSQLLMVGVRNPPWTGRGSKQPLAAWEETRVAGERYAGPEPTCRPHTGASSHDAVLIYSRYFEEARSTFT